MVLLCRLFFCAKSKNSVPIFGKLSSQKWAKNSVFGRKLSSKWSKNPVFTPKTQFFRPKLSSKSQKLSFSEISKAWIAWQVPKKAWHILCQLWIQIWTLTQLSFRNIMRLLKLILYQKLYIYLHYTLSFFFQRGNCWQIKGWRDPFELFIYSVGLALLLLYISMVCHRDFISSGAEMFPGNCKA